jgi:predicted transcriptional regulator
MKNVTISLSEDLVHILDSICKDCDTSRYAFAKEAVLEKIERHAKDELEEPSKEDDEKASEHNAEQKDRTEPPWLW